MLPCNDRVRYYFKHIISVYAVRFFVLETVWKFVSSYVSWFQFVNWSKISQTFLSISQSGAFTIGRNIYDLHT
jgi:hypothetical protein